MVLRMSTGGVYLKLDPVSFTMSGYPTLRSYRWADVDQFNVLWYCPGHVFFNFSSTYHEDHPPARRRSLFGFEACIVALNYGTSALELAQVLNDWRSRYTSGA